MAAELLDCVEIGPADAQASVIWMHGLGADAHDFEPLVPHLQMPESARVRFVFPNAPKRAITVNGGAVMPGWYDITQMSINRGEDAAGVRESEGQIRELIKREVQRGVASQKILLAGFSQGGAMALHAGLRHPEALAGILALSCYVPLASTLEDERHPANQEISIFQAHGTADPVVPLMLGEASRDQLIGLGYKPKWETYPMAHEVNWDEIQDIGAWLREIFG